LQEIYNWYENQQTNLGDRFLQAIDECVTKILATPTAASIRYDNIRCKLLKRFPYLLHYSFDEKGQVVIIYRVYHTGRQPLWKM